LQGGMHLVLGVDTDKAVESRLDILIDQTEGMLKEEKIIYKRVNRAGDTGFTVIVYDDAAAKALDALIEKNYPSFTSTTDSSVGGFISKTFQVSTQELEQIREYAIRQALETLRNRVDEFGVSEPTLQRQTGNRILIQLPGVKDPQRAIDLLGKTARLEFKMVMDDNLIEDALKGNIPVGAQLLFERKVDQFGKETARIPLVVESKTILTGDLLSDAQVRIDSRFNEPYVAITFNSAGAKRFDQITAANVGRRMAIILDDNIYSAPVIRERISGGHAQISGSFSEQEATDLSIMLRAGSLPAPVHILENRTVGPSLGHDSIQQGITSVIVGGLLVVLVMVMFYKGSGIVANVALIMNLVFIMAMLSLFKATLTLPGIAGIVLTVGMAVDANVLIFERIREELRLGKPAYMSLSNGFSKAFMTIIDANITTLIAALVLFQFGTGPVKGFAVTLSVGILASMFTAIFVSRTIFDFFMTRKQIKRLSI